MELYVFTFEVLAYFDINKTCDVEEGNMFSHPYSKHWVV